MPLVRINDYEKEPSNSLTRSVFWNLSVTADNESPKKEWELPNGKTIRGRYEDVWFLGRFQKDGVLISSHNKADQNDKTSYLCNRSFESEGERRQCPMCEEHMADKKNSRFRARNQHYLIPVLCIRRQNDPQISSSGKHAIIPIYWFTMNITSYRDDYKQNYLRLRDANEKHPIHKSPYRIFAKRRGEGEIQEWYFKALKENDNHEITVDHPLIDEWLDPDTGKWLWNSDYQELLASLAIVRYAQYVNPRTHEVFDYDGEYDNAVAIFEDVVERYGSPRLPLEGEDASYSNSDDDEELD